MRLTIEISNGAFSLLQDEAMVERRTVRDQAAVLVEQALGLRRHRQPWIALSRAQARLLLADAERGNATGNPHDAQAALGNVIDLLHHLMPVWEPSLPTELEVDAVADGIADTPLRLEAPA